MYLSKEEKNAMVALVQHLVMGNVDTKYSKEQKVILVEMLADLGITLDEFKQYCTQPYSFQTAKQITGNIDVNRRKLIGNSITNTIRRKGISGVWALLLYKTDIFKGLSAQDIYPEDEDLFESIFTAVRFNYQMVK